MVEGWADIWSQEEKERRKREGKRGRGEGRERHTGCHPIKLFMSTTPVTYVPLTGPYLLEIYSTS